MLDDRLITFVWADALLVSSLAAPVRTVSYTHLDVYKRQLLTRPLA